MISVIICSKDERQLQKIKTNIAQTIEVAYEVIAIDNSAGLYGISEAYNTGASKAAFDYLCFMHEDLEFNEKGWGHKVIQHLTEHQLNLIGVAGGKYKNRIVTGWGSIPQLNRGRIYHRKADGSKIPLYNNPDNKLIEEVVVLDGVWLATTRQIWNEFKFDQQLLKGFHGYDLDFSLRVSRKYHTAVVYDINLTHYSEGSYTKEWLKDSFVLHKKLKKYLPAKANFFAENNLKQIDNKIFIAFAHKIMLNKNFSPFLFLQWTRYALMTKTIRPKPAVKMILKAMLHYLHLIAN